ncbi:MAG TPA: YqgQ family protein [Niallia sp.]|nr:YqgQ family protein [Niallia sp.]
MKTVYDVQQYLKKYGTIIYIGDRIGDLQLMKTEIKELNASQLMNKQDFESAIFILNQEIQKLEDEKIRGN